mmetsp:Transcript_58815/g.127877  ORF Transcript_58815/g.127877 Transcript_58815/m.127877 type:complete len:192 (+) Transcript_58815:1-576(+)
MTYFFVGCFGYLTFLDCTKSDVLKDFEFSGTPISTTMDVLRLGIGAALIFSYPLIIWELRHCIDEVIFGHRPYAFKRYLCLNVGILSFCTLIAIVVKNISYVFDIAGSTSSAMILLIMPSGIFLKLHQQKTRTKILSKQNAVPLAVFFLGVFLIPLCVGVAIQGFIDKPSTPDTCDACRSSMGRNTSACVF